jgi:hypothetical protein
MIGENSQAKSQPVQNNDPDGALPDLSDSDIEELIQFFKLPDKWDHEAQCVT